MERFIILFIMIWGPRVFAITPLPTEINHPGNDKVTLDFERIEIRHLGRSSFLYLPHRPQGEKAPLLVFGHGQAIGEESYDRTLEHLAGKGIAVLFVAYDSGFLDQDWRRMASDWNEITQSALNQYPEKLDSRKILYSGHSQGGRVGLMAAGAPQQPGVGSVLVFAPTGYDEQYLKAIDPQTVVTLIYGEEDSIIGHPLMEEIYKKLNVSKKQFIEVTSYPSLKADHYFLLNQLCLMGGHHGVSALHRHGVWKWLVAAAWDLEEGGPVAQPSVYGDLAQSTGENFTHKVTRNFEVVTDYVIKLHQQPSTMVNTLLPDWESLNHSWYKAYLTQNQVRQLRAEGSVRHIGRNHRLKTLTTPNDLDSRQWAFQNPLGFDLSAEKAWSIKATAPDVVVAVIDSGIDMNHRDLKNNLWVNNREANGEPGVDDDGNGYTDDIHGFNFATKRPDPDDTRGHGTMVSGMIGAIGNNNYGITGMAWQVQLMALNMFPNLWGTATLDSALKAIDYAINNGAHIINASWGQADDDLEPDAGFIMLEEAIERANEKGITFVAAAGNNGADNDLKGMVPATLTNDNIISVGAMNRYGQPWSKSNFGKSNVHVMAPGEEIYTTHTEGFRMPSGTSISAPIVSGLIALMLEQNPDLTPTEIKTILVNSCDESPELKRLSQCEGYLNAHQVLERISSNVSF
jgi:thermitase